MLQFLTALVSFFSLLKTGGGLNPNGLYIAPPQGETGGGLSPDGRS
jgi:hypothetical protein